MPNPIDGLKPELVWKHFAAISRIPRGSKNEAAITKHVAASARKLGLECKVDKAGNVVVRKPASPGREKAPSVCLQGHMDMVCEKLGDSPHNFLKDPITIVRKDDYLTADGTTLGADNGIYVAAALALMEDKSVEHGALEFLFTVDEETGLTGANSLEPGSLRSKILLNLDSEDEGVLFIGCSGGIDSTGVWKTSWDNAPAGSTALSVTVKGLKGGHSGLEIDKGRANAIKILARALQLLAGFGVRVASINGGNKHNAIPREAEALVFMPTKNLEAAKAAFGEFAATIEAEIMSVDPDGVFGLVETRTRTRKVLKRTLQGRILDALTVLPHGVIKMSADIAGLVETSTNLAVVRTEARRIRVVTSQRSSVASEIVEISHMVRTAFKLAGAEVHGTDGYPGWKPNVDSAILRLCRSTYASLFGKEPDVRAIHAGLECGIIGEKNPGMDMISFGPTLSGVHTPDERIYYPTVEKFWTFLLAVLKAV